MDAWQIVTGVLVFIGVLGAAVKALPAVWGFVKSVAKVPDMAEALVRLADSADQLLAQVTPTAGASMMEKIDQLESNQQQMLAWQAERQVLYDELSVYSHTWKHDLAQKLTPVVGWMPVIDKRVKAVDERLESIEDQLTTAGLIADRIEGRRVEADVAEGDRTAAEQGAVDRLTDDPNEGTPHGN